MPLCLKMWCISEVIAGWIDIYDLGLYSGKVHGEGMWWNFGLYKSSILHRIFDTKRLFVGTKNHKNQNFEILWKMHFLRESASWHRICAMKLAHGAPIVPWSCFLAAMRQVHGSFLVPWGRFMAYFWCHEAGSWHKILAIKWFTANRAAKRVFLAYFIKFWVCQN